MESSGFPGVFNPLRLGVLLFFFLPLYSQTDVVVFSYDRPMQLYALLESMERNVEGIHQLAVIYRSSGSGFSDGYRMVKRAFPRVAYTKQKKRSRGKDFSKALLDAAFGQGAEGKYVLFATDDMVFTKPIDLSMAAEAMDLHGAYAFYFRLGRNITSCYMTAQKTGVPAFEEVGEGLLTWVFEQGQGDWRYPHNVDGTLYRKEMIEKEVRSLEYTDPSIFESKWAKRARLKQKGICYLSSCVINIPLNRVTTTFGNSHMNWKSPAELLHDFLYGYKIDIGPLQGMENRSPHVEVTPSFILR